MPVVSPQKRAIVVASIVAATLTIMKLIAGVASGSVAVLASAIDSLLDMFISVFNFFAIKKSEENPNDRYQYGKGKIQAIAGVIEGTIITVSGLFIIYKGFEKLIDGESISLMTPSILVMLISIAVTFALVRYLSKVAKDTGNIVIKADTLHYQTDLWSNAAVLLSLLLVWVSDFAAIDALFGIGIGLYVVYVAYGIIKEGIKILLDHSLEGEIVARIGEIISKHPKVTSYHWLKTRTDGTTNFVEFHIVLYPEIMLIDAHKIGNEIEAQVIKNDDKKKWLITAHYDPYDDEEIDQMALYGNKNR
ncbi:MAG: cation transporter [Sulfurovum sp.]|nr:cation transporter [Sulfurovum sp.]